MTHRQPILADRAPRPGTGSCPGTRLDSLVSRGRCNADYICNLDGKSYDKPSLLRPVCASFGEGPSFRGSTLGGNLPAHWSELEADLECDGQVVSVSPVFDELALTYPE